MPPPSDDPSASASQDSPAPEEPEADSATASGPEGPDEPAPTPCPNCGHDFRGNYCPNCGQEASPSVSIDDVAGSFLRELADVEGGLWATVKGLTLRPGDTLRAYLGGARTQFISPGRYLLVSILVAVGVFRGLMWFGLLEDIESFYAESTGGMDIPDPTQVFMDTVARVSQTQWWNTAITLASVGLLALILRRMFRDELEDWAAALATSAFLNGHAAILWNGVVLLHAAVVFAWTGQPLGIASVSVYPLLIVVLYVGAATYRFVPDWRNAVKGGLGALWVNAEAIGVGSLLVIGYLLLFVRPPAELSTEGIAFIVIVSGVYATPLLLHAAVEAYYRLR